MSFLGGPELSFFQKSEVSLFGKSEVSFLEGVWRVSIESLWRGPLEGLRLIALGRCLVSYFEEYVSNSFRVISSKFLKNFLGRVFKEDL